jgi:hypothetical protein
VVKIPKLELLVRQCKRFFVTLAELDFMPIHQTTDKIYPIARLNNFLEHRTRLHGKNIRPSFN